MHTHDTRCCGLQHNGGLQPRQAEPEAAQVAFKARSRVGAHAPAEGRATHARVGVEGRSSAWRGSRIADRGSHPPRSGILSTLTSQRRLGFKAGSSGSFTGGIRTLRPTCNRRGASPPALPPAAHAGWGPRVGAGGRERGEEQGHWVGPLAEVGVRSHAVVRRQLRPDFPCSQPGESVWSAALPEEREQTLRRQRGSGCPGSIGGGCGAPLAPPSCNRRHRRQ